ncbi:MAG: MBL fold metallo-hydrolase [Spirochaetaceae bacterium]|nr:MBL fold metallo-hydrolase [Spirochaetaceae bacterium]
MIITSLVDDYCPRRGLKGQHGFSLLIEAGGRRYLFDAGQDGLLASNAEALGLDLSGLDGVILSHGHYDHGGGLFSLYERLGKAAPPLYVGRGYDDPRRSRDGVAVRDIGLPEPLLPESAGPPRHVDELKELSGGLFILPAVSPSTVRPPAARFRRIAEGEESLDDFRDELSLVVLEGGTISVVTGCAHRGVEAIVDAALSAFPGRALKAVAGGFHLAEAPRETLGVVARSLAQLRPATLLCGHCTGPRGFAALAAELGDKAAWLSCGLRTEL